MTSLHKNWTKIVYIERMPADVDTVSPPDDAKIRRLVQRRRTVVPLWLQYNCHSVPVTAAAGTGYSQFPCSARKGIRCNTCRAGFQPMACVL